MNFDTFDDWWWAYLYIAIAGWLVTDFWRWMGVVAGNRLKEGSLPLLWVRAVANSMIAAIIAKLILIPTGSLAEFDIAVRVGAVAAGFLVFMLAKQKIIFGIATALSALLLGNYLLA